MLPIVSSISSNHPDFAAPRGNPTAGFAKFGTTTATPDASSAVLDSGGLRRLEADVQFGVVVFEEF
jgi:hypothetical protein